MWEQGFEARQPAVKTHTQPLLSTVSKDRDRILDRRDPEYK